MRWIAFLLSLWAVLWGAGARSEPKLSLKATGINTFEVILDSGGKAMAAASVRLSFNPAEVGVISPQHIRVVAPGWDAPMTMVQAAEVDIVTGTAQPSPFSGPLIECTFGTGCERKIITLEEWVLADSEMNEYRWPDGWVSPWPDQPQQIILGCRLEFRNVPIQAEARHALRPAPEVALIVPDAANYSSTVLLKVASSMPPGAASWGTILVWPENGVAVFPAFAVDRPGLYVLEARAGTYTGYSAPFEVTSPPPYTMSDLLRAAQVASGLADGTPDDVYRLNAHWSMTPMQHLDLLDVTRIARRITGLEASP